MLKADFLGFPKSYDKGGLIFMRMLRRFRPSPALVIASVALFIALGGTGYAVTRLPANSVTTRQVVNHSLLAVDFKRGQIPAGPQIGESAMQSVDRTPQRGDDRVQT